MASNADFCCRSLVGEAATFGAEMHELPRGDLVVDWLTQWAYRFLAVTSASSLLNGEVRRMSASRGAVLQASLWLVGRSLLPLLFPTHARVGDTWATISLQGLSLALLQTVFLVAALESAAILPVATQETLAWLTAFARSKQVARSGILLGYETVVFIAGPLLACAEAATIAVDVIWLSTMLYGTIDSESQNPKSRQTKKVVGDALVLCLSALSFGFSVLVASMAQSFESWAQAPIALVGILFSIHVTQPKSNLLQVSLLMGYLSLLIAFGVVETSTLRSEMFGRWLLPTQGVRAQGLLLLSSGPLSAYTARRALALVYAAAGGHHTLPERSVIQDLACVTAVAFRLVIYDGVFRGEYNPAGSRLTQALVCLVTHTIFLSRSRPLGPEPRSSRKPSRR